ncbi:MAG TPA: glycine--tRNA ligase [Acholeplasmataceae bacterium]|nr:glycine--tRNA ligase [Acholeplasmataceae bacterium]
MEKITMDELVAYLKHQGFVFQGSEIYGGLANSWDYGPLGVEVLNNIKKAWWKKFVQESPYNVGLDSSIILSPLVWEASGHLKSFSDPLVDCKACKMRFRADKLIEDFDKSINVEKMKDDDLDKFIEDHKVPCPNCGKTEFTKIRKFNLMYKTYQGVVEDSTSVVYLRPETAQGIFVNFKNVQRTTRKKVPFGIAQIGKAFRNEITPGNFIFRTREFEQMEMQFFCKPGTDLEWFKYWKNYAYQFLKYVGLKEEELRFRDHSKEELSFYSVATTDIEFLYPFGWGELWGIADRTDYDLTVHQEHSKKSMEYFDPDDNSTYIPYVIEPSLGVNRLLLAILTSAYDKEVLENGEEREVLRFTNEMAPIKIAVLPLTNKLKDESYEIYELLNKHFMVQYDTSGAIGRRYRRQDAIGTPYCVTFDFDSLDDKKVTVRMRDSMEQERVSIDNLVSYFREKF